MASRASDIYSLGCLLWCAVTGTAPYGEDGVQAAIGHMQDPIPQLDGTGPAVEAANAILMISMAKDPAQRYTSTAAMRAHLVEAAQAADGATDVAADAVAEVAADAAQLEPVPPWRFVEPNDARDEAEPDTTRRDLATSPAVGMGTFDDGDLTQSADRRGYRRRRYRRYVVAAVVLLLVGAGGVAMLSVLDRVPSTEDATDGDLPSDETPSSSSSVPAPFETQNLYAFTRMLFPADQCEVPFPGERPFLEKKPDLEQIYCEGDEYGGIFFRKQTLAGLREERPFYLSEAQPGSVRRLPEESQEEGLLDGPQYVYVHEDGTTRIYWQSDSCLCAGVIQAPDNDAATAVQFWEGS